MSLRGSKRRKLNGQKVGEHSSAGDSGGSDVESEIDSTDSSDEFQDDVQKKRPVPFKEQKRKASNHEATDLAASQFAGASSAKTSIFNLEVNELIAENKHNYEKKRTKAEDALKRLKSIIESLSDVASKSVAQAEKDLQHSKVSIPFPDPKPGKDVNWKVSYSKPSDINVVGSYALKTQSKNNESQWIDLAVTMPSAVFQEKDILDYRYFHKRAFYLARIAAGLKSTKELGYGVRYGLLSENPLQPIIRLHASNENSCKYNVQILLAVSSDLFKLKKTFPDATCVRRTSELVNGNEANYLEATPFYNASLRSESSVFSYLRLLHRTKSSCSTFTDACLLGRIWLQQRNFGSGLSQGGFGHHEWAALIALLLDGGGPQGRSVLSAGYSSFQLFKASLNFLASRDLRSKPLSLGTADIDLPRGNHPLLFDGDRGLNICFKMSPWSYSRLRDEATRTLEMINNGTFDYFEEAFILKAESPLQRYDACFQLSIDSMRPRTEKDDKHTDFCPPSMRHSQHLQRVLVEGLGDRARLIDLSWIGPQESSLKSDQGSFKEGATLTIGLLLDAANASRALDRGPAAEEKEAAAAFRKFWGEKAELRRFKDGSIQESLTWSEKHDERSIVSQIIAYLLERHFALSAQDKTQFVADDFARLISTQPSGIFSKVASFEPTISTFMDLEKTLRSFENLPLHIRQVSACDPSLRYSSVDAPRQNSRTRTPSKPSHVLVTFEASGRWPDDLCAIQRIKAAVLLKIGSMLEQQEVEGMQCRVGIESEKQAMLNTSFLDITYPDRTIFRLRIFTDREQTLLTRAVKDKHTSSQEREEAGRALAITKRDFVQRPLQTQSIRTLCTRFPLLSATIRLTKIWFDAHLLGSHFLDELIELFVSHVFVQPAPFSAPASIMAGFVRTLALLARWDWRTDPLIVDLSQEMDPATLHTIELNFKAWRSLDPAMNRVALFVASNLDPEGVTWTQFSQPPKVVAARMTALARSSFTLVREQAMELNCKSLFASSTSDYDFVLHLDPSLRGQPSKKSGEFKNLQIQSSGMQDSTLLSHDPVAAFVNELKGIFGNNILFFYRKEASPLVSNAAGTASLHVIAGLWNQQTTARRGWKVNFTYSTKPVSAGETGETPDEPQLELNKTAVLNEIARLGDDMVKRIEVVR